MFFVRHENNPPYPPTPLVNCLQLSGSSFIYMLWHFVLSMPDFAYNNDCSVVSAETVATQIADAEADATGHL